MELLLDKGAIVIVPFPPTDEAQPTRWRVVVVDETVLEQTIEIGVKVKVSRVPLGMLRVFLTVIRRTLMVKSYAS